MKEYQDLLDKYLTQDTLNALHENMLCDSLPFLESVFTKLKYAFVEINSVEFIIESLKEDRQNWFEELHKKKTAGLPEVKSISYFGQNLDSNEAIEKLVFSFFQYLHSVYDISANLINTALLANQKKSINSISFKNILEILKEFPVYKDVKTLIDTTKASDSFKYIDDLNNINKHQYNMALHVMLDISDGEVETKIGSFEKKGTHHPEVGMTYHMENCLKDSVSYIDNLLGSIFTYLKNNIHKYNSNRVHNINAWFQKCKNDYRQDGGYLFIITPTTYKVDDIFQILYVVKNQKGRYTYKNIHSEDIFLKDLDHKVCGMAEYIKGTYDDVNPIFELLEYKEYRITKVGDVERDIALRLRKPKQIFGDVIDINVF